MGEQPEPRPTAGRAGIYGGFWAVFAKILDLGLFHDLPPIGGSCSNFRPGLVEGDLGEVGHLGLARAAKFIGGRRKSRNATKRERRRPAIAGTTGRF